MDFPAETFEGPAFDLVVSRSLCRPLEGRGFPSQLVAMEELRRLTCLARRYVIVQFPPKAPFSLSSLALQLDTGFSLEGFVPLPESGPESDPGGSPQGLPGDYYILANSQAGAPLPAPFGISGGPSVLSPIRIQGGAPGELSDALSRLRRLEDQGRLPEAIPFAFKLAALRPWDAKIRVTLAMNLAIMGKVVEGERILRGVLAENPNDRMARMALLKIFQKIPEETKDDIWDIRPEPRFHSDMPPKPPVTSPDLRDAWDEGGLG
jgi:hypothetical protein